MRIEVAVKVIIVLLIILILSLVAALLLMQNAEEETPGETSEATVSVSDSETSAETDEPADTTPDSTEATQPEDTKPEDTKPEDTKPEDTKPEDTKPEDTKPEDTKPEDTKPEDTEPEDTEPAEIVLRKTFKTDTGTVLNLRAAVTGAKLGDGKIRLTVSLYLDHYSISFGARSDCRLAVGDTEKVFTTPALQQTEEKATATLLQTVEIVVNEGETVMIRASYPARAVYAGVSIQTLTIEEALTVQS